MNHRRQEGTDGYDIKININLNHDIPILFQLKFKNLLNFRGAESCLCSCIQIRKSLKAYIL